MDKKKSKVSFWRKLMINSDINCVLSDNEEAQASGAAALIKEGEKVLPFVNAERDKLNQHYLRLREQQGRPIGETIIRGEEDIPFENIKIMEQDDRLAYIVEKISEHVGST